MYRYMIMMILMILMMIIICCNYYTVRLSLSLSLYTCSFSLAVHTSWFSV